MVPCKDTILRPSNTPGWQSIGYIKDGEFVALKGVPANMDPNAARYFTAEEGLCQVGDVTRGQPVPSEPVPPVGDIAPTDQSLPGQGSPMALVWLAAGVVGIAVLGLLSQSRTKATDPTPNGGMSWSIGGNDDES